MSYRQTRHAALGILLFGLASVGSAQLAIQGDIVHTMAGKPIRDGVVLIRGGKISAVGTKADIKVPAGWQTLKAKVVMPGLVDAHSTVGLSGIFNVDHDRDELERSEPIQPQLRAIDAYNTHEELVAWVRSFGVTTVHTGHAPGELVSGQTIVVKTTGNTVEQAAMKRLGAVAVTLTEAAQKSGSKSPGTRGKMIAMLRQELLKAREYAHQLKSAPADKKPPIDLKLQTFAQVLARRVPLMVTADRAQDIASALRLAREFKIRLWLDSGAEAYMLIKEIKAANVPVIIHPTMARVAGQRENLSFETAAKLSRAGIRVVFQSGYEPYVPKTRVVLFEAGLAAAHGLGFQKTLEAITIEPAKLLGIASRVGSLEVGKDGDVALYDGDPFEYTTHCVGVVINGKVVSKTAR